APALLWPAPSSRPTSGLLLGKCQSNESARRIAMTRCFLLLCSAHGDEVGARGEGYLEASCSGESSQAHLTPNWDSYLNLRRSGNRCGTRVSPRLQYPPDVFFVTAHVEAVPAFEIAVRGDDSVKGGIRHQAAGDPYQLSGEPSEFDGGVPRQIHPGLSCRSGTWTCTRSSVSRPARRFVSRPHSGRRAEACGQCNCGSDRSSGHGRLRLQ